MMQVRAFALLVKYLSKREPEDKGSQKLCDFYGVRGLIGAEWSE